MIIFDIILLTTIVSQAKIQNFQIAKELNETFQFAEYNCLFEEKAMEWDCYFTIEENTNDDHKRRLKYGLCYQNINLLSPDISLEQFLVELNRQFPNYLGYRDPKNSAIVRIIDKSFLKNTNYVLEKKYSLQFVGCPTELLLSLNNKDPQINWPLARANSSNPLYVSCAGEGGREKIRVQGCLLALAGDA